jgi:t-SNARE complex subunit (syntaxin)
MAFNRPKEFNPDLADFYIELPNWREELGFEEDFDEAG